MGENHDGPFTLAIHQDACVELSWLSNFYEQKGFAKKYNKPADLAKAMKVSEVALTHKEPLYAFKITCALYSCAGGLSTGFKDGRVLNAQKQPIRGLFAAGETTACEFKKLWSVAGIPLLWAIRSGRTAGAAAAREAQGKEPARADLKQLIMK